jgi:hypothetical protein
MNGSTRTPFSYKLLSVIPTDKKRQINQARVIQIRCSRSRYGEGVWRARYLLEFDTFEGKKRRQDVQRENRAAGPLSNRSSLRTRVSLGASHIGIK